MSTSRGSTTGRDDELIAVAAKQVAAARLHELTVAGSGSAPSASAVDLSLDGGESIPGYQILAERQRGGQGVVYEAIQRATRRRVAIKVLHERQVGGASRFRFEREVEILAQLRHPNIVTIHDSSQAGSRLYYVMDFIDGVGFDDFAAGIADRDPVRILPAFQKVCEAVNAAHLRGVMHRDLKPSNILVDRSGEPRVLDFGLAKSLGQTDVEHAEMTATGQFLGSLMWASPEQVEARHDRLDIRCDVYSLGVILFHALTGQVPYPPPHTVTDVARHIRETEPLRPTALKAGIDNELETIILKCLQKDPERRYQSAGDLGRDIARYLAHEPIEAKRDSIIYFFRKRLRRHRAAVGVSATIMLVSTVSAIVSLVAWREADRQRVRAAESERVAAKRADESRRVASYQAELLGRLDPEAMGRSLRELIEKYASADPTNAPTRHDFFASATTAAGMTDVARETIIKSLLEPAEREIESRFAGHAATEAELRDTMAELYRRFARLADAERNIRRSLELRRELPDADLSGGLNRLAVILNERGEVASAETSQREALAYAERRHGPRSEHVAIALDNLAAVLADRNDNVQAEQLLRRALAIWIELYGEDHPDTMTCLNTLAIQLSLRGEMAEAESMAARVLDVRRRILNPSDPLIPASLRNLARLQYQRGDLVTAERNLRESLRMEQLVRGNDHPAIAENLNAIAVVLLSREEFDEAEVALRKAAELELRLLGATHPATARTLTNLGRLLGRSGRHVEAVEFLDRAHAGYRSTYGAKHPDSARSAILLADSLLALGDARSAEALLCDVVDYFGEINATGESALRVRLLLAKSLAAQGEFAEAEHDLLTAASDARGTSRAAEVESAFEALYQAWELVDAPAAQQARAARRTVSPPNPEPR